MSWAPTDLVADADLLSYESTLLSTFQVSTFRDKTQKALEDWMWPILRANGYSPQRFRTRYVATEVLGYTASVYTDLTGASSSTDTDDVNLATVFATVGTDLLYIGSSAQFRGLYLALTDNVSSVAGVLTVKYWAGAWKTLASADGTIGTAGKTLSAGGSVTWSLPVDWATRGVNGTDLRYWARLSVSATPTGAKAAQIGTIRRSVLCGPAALRTLGLIFTEAPSKSQDGPWREKADWYLREADLALQRALPLVASEFDTDEDEQIDPTEEGQTPGEAGAGGWKLERA